MEICTGAMESLSARADLRQVSSIHKICAGYLDRPFQNMRLLLAPLNEDDLVLTTWTCTGYFGYPF